MQINLGDERIVELESSFTLEEVRDRALAKRGDAFGQLAKLLQRPRLEDIEISALQKRLEPFWSVAATARYEYDRRHTYRVETTPEVHEVTVYGQTLPATHERGNAFSLEAMEHCVEEIHRELLADAITGHEGELAKYQRFPKRDVAAIADLTVEGTVVVSPEVRSSFVVRKVVGLLMKTFQADQVCEERIDVEQVALFYRPVFAVEYLWKPRAKKQVVEFDGLTGDFRAEGGEIKRQVSKVLDNDALFDIGADAIGTVLPGANVAVKLGRLAARKVVR